MAAQRPIRGPHESTVRCVVPEAVTALIGVPAAELPPADRETIQSPAGEAAARLAAFAGFSNAGRYLALDVVGRGGMGVVHRVVDLALNRETAMKTIAGPLDASPVAMLRFLEEAQITGQLDHPNVVPVHDFGVTADGKRAYFTMKLVKGQTLEQLVLRQHLELRPDAAYLEQMLGIFQRICEGVAFAHARHVVHRDLKPANVLVGTHGQVYVMDWGLALVIDGGRPSQSGAGEAPRVEGTLTYMAPEQTVGQIGAIDARTDVFGLGGVLYAILTGHGPFAARTPEVSLALASECIVTPPEEVASWSIPPELSCIVMKALARAPDDRYQSVDALAHDVREFMRGGGWFATRSYPAGAVIVREGDDASEAFVVTAGRCEVTKLVDGQPQKLRMLGPGDVFGETAVLTAKPRTATVTALEPVTVKVVTSASLDHELERNPWMGAFVRALAERFRELDARPGR